jgi:hypothetical protein
MVGMYVTIQPMEFERVHIEDDRFYLIEGKYYPSVTTILSDYPKGHHLQKWIGEHGWEGSRQLMNIAGEQGTKVHEACEDLINGKTLELKDYTERAWAMIQAFVNFWEDYSPETQEKEHCILSKKVGYAGTIDWAGYVTPPGTKKEVGKRMFVRLDWKTSKYIHDEYELQLVAYDRAEVERGKQEADELLIVQFGTTTKRGYSIRTIKDRPLKYKMFKHVYEIWKYRNPDAKPFQKSLPTSLSLPTLNSSSTTSSTSSAPAKKKVSRKEPLQDTQK